jgi:serine/threonine protein kinase
MAPSTRAPSVENTTGGRIVEATLGNGGTTLSREAFLDNLRDSGLSGADEMIRAVGSAAPAPPDGAAVADLLVSKGLLTAFQANGIRERKFAELVIGNYEILDRLGAGGMGTVFKARHRRMQRVVALKILPRSSGLPEEFLQRFQREVVVISRLAHPNIVMAFDADESPAGPYLVMEFVNGQDLSSVVRDRGPLPVREAVDAIVQSARAMEYAHGQGIIHRDIKPANLLRDNTGTVKVADLGLARVNEMLSGGKAPSSGLTQAGGILGTVDYMPPEQAFDSSTIDNRADIYSLGCTLYFLLAGEPPYSGSNVMATLFKHSAGTVPSLLTVRGDVPPALDAVFQKTLAKAPGDRPQNMTELRQALEAIPLEATGTTPVLLRGGARTDSAMPGVLPPSEQTMVASPSPDGGVTVALGSRTTKPTAPILLVEPSRTQANIIRKYLLELGYQEVVVAPNGQKTLEHLRATRFHAVVSAVHLDDMPGAQLLKTIREELRQTEVGFVAISSSSSDSSDLTPFRGAPRAALLPKPFDRDKLRLALSAATAPVASAPVATAPGPSYASLRVLLVDDSAAARCHERGVLAGLGFRHITEATDGTEAIAQLAQNSFDLVVTDYNMPLVDGRALVAYIRQRSANPAVPIVMVSQESDPARLQEVRKLGVSEICAKTFQPEVVRGILDRVLRR